MALLVPLQQADRHSGCCPRPLWATPGAASAIPGGAVRGGECSLRGGLWGFDKAVSPGAALVRAVTGERRLGLPKACRHGPICRCLPTWGDSASP